MELNSIPAVETVELEASRGKGNSQCSGEMRRDWEEHRCESALLDLN